MGKPGARRKRNYGVGAKNSRIPEPHRAITSCNRIAFRPLFRGRSLLEWLSTRCRDGVRGGDLLCRTRQVAYVTDR
jgi:hypothetical protein